MPRAPIAYVFAHRAAERARSSPPPHGLQSSIFTRKTQGKKQRSPLLLFVCSVTWPRSEQDAEKSARLTEKANVRCLRAAHKSAPAAEAAERSETLVALYRKINALDEPYRTVVYLRLAGDLTFEEIGRVLDHTGNWARVTYYRAKERLKEHETTE